MTTNQLFFALTGVIVTVAGALKIYIDSKVDPIAKNVEMLVHYMVQHSERISVLEEKTKKL